MPDGTVPFHYQQFDGDWHAVDAQVIEEGSLTIFVNGQELATLMCTPRQPLQLAIGFLANEGFIAHADEVRLSHVCQQGDCVDLWLAHSAGDQPLRKIITSGCTGGQTFDDLTSEHPPLTQDLRLSPQQIAVLHKQLQDQDSLYARARGVHTSGLSDGQQLLLIAEDIGRHNTLDRLQGECLLQGIDPSGMLLLTTGRVSSEMINKAYRMGCPVVASRTSPTSLSVTLARLWNITLCGYVRRGHMNVYAHPERLGLSDLGDESSASLEITTHPSSSSRDG